MAEDDPYELERYWARLRGPLSERKPESERPVEYTRPTHHFGNDFLFGTPPHPTPGFLDTNPFLRALLGFGTTTSPPTVVWACLLGNLPGGPPVYLGSRAPFPVEQEATGPVVRCSFPPSLVEATVHGVVLWLNETDQEPIVTVAVANPPHLFPGDRAQIAATIDFR